MKKLLGCLWFSMILCWMSGTQGCGGSAYSHKSQTRNATIVGPMDGVSDVVATYGTWSATWKRRMMCGGLSVLR